MQIHYPSRKDKKYIFTETRRFLKIIGNDKWMWSMMEKFIRFLKNRDKYKKISHQKIVKNIPLSPKGKKRELQERQTIFTAAMHEKATSKWQQTPIFQSSKRLLRSRIYRLSNKQGSATKRKWKENPVMDSENPEWVELELT